MRFPGFGMGPEPKPRVRALQTPGNIHTGMQTYSRRTQTLIRTHSYETCICTVMHRDAYKHMCTHTCMLTYPRAHACLRVHTRPSLPSGKELLRV